MASIESAARNAGGGDLEDSNMTSRTVPIITTPTPTPTIKTSAPSPSSGDPMDITPSNNSHNSNNNSSIPPHVQSAQTSRNKTPDREGPDPVDRHNGPSSASKDHLSSNSNSRAMPAPAAAAAAVHQPKIVQTAFIHKLYKYVHSIYPHSHAGI